MNLQLNFVRKPWQLPMLLFFCKQWILKIFVETFPMYSHGVTTSPFSTLVSIFYCWLPTSTIASQRKYLLWCARYQIPMLSLYDPLNPPIQRQSTQYHTTNKYSSLNWSSTSIRIHACLNVSFSFHIHSKIKCLHFIFEPGPQVACRQRSPHTQIATSPLIALGVLHAVDVASVALQRQKKASVREEGVCCSAALQERWLSFELASLFCFTFWFFFSVSFICRSLSFFLKSGRSSLSSATRQMAAFWTCVLLFLQVLVCLLRFSWFCKSFFFFFLFCGCGRRRGPWHGSQNSCSNFEPFRKKETRNKICWHFYIGTTWLTLQKQWIVNKHWIWICFRHCHAVFPQCHKVIQQWHLNKIELNKKQLTKYSLNSETERSN